MEALRPSAGIVFALACVAANGCSYGSHIATSVPTSPAWVALTPAGELVDALAWVDLDADGHDDLVVLDVLPATDAAEAQPRVQILYGAPARITEPAVFDASLVGPRFATLDGAFRPTPYELSASAGDLDGDGIEDLAVGVGFETSGTLYVLYGGARLSGELDLGANSTTLARDDLAFAHDVRALGDLDGDGASELALRSDDARTWIVPSDAGRDVALGDEVAARLFALGDVNGDGLADVALGRRGAMSVAFGPQGPGQLASGTALALEVDGVELEEARGADLDGDGDAEILAIGRIGSDAALLAIAIEGYEAVVEAIVELGDASTLALSAGDSNGDGRSDPLLGSPRVECDRENRCRGRAYRFLDVLSAESARDASHEWSGEARELAPEELGAHVAADGDLDGDGNADAVVSGPYGPVRLIYGERQEP